MKNENGFTLVELLAVIVIMGILMMVAIPSVTRTIENSRKDSFVNIAKSYGNAARNLWTSDNLMCGYGDTYASAMDDGDYYILIDTENTPSVLLDQGGKSSWGNCDVKGYVRVNVTTKNDKKITKFYVALSDGTHGIYDDLGNPIELDKLARGDMLMNLDNSSQKDMLESIATDPFIVEEVTTCNTDGGSRTVEGISFSDDSWLRISGAVKSGEYPYQVGDTREVDLGDLGTYTLRVANTTPCTTETSHTACGFVMEFADTIALKNINDNNKNIGGWPATTLRTYLNNEVFNSLPSDLRRVIVDTTVVSGHGSTIGETNFVSTDKLYLLATAEVFDGGHEYDSARTLTRQLDYYDDLDVNFSNYAGAIKKLKGTSESSWWLRSAHSSNTSSFFTVHYYGSSQYYHGGSIGVSPAFRIA